MLYNDNTTWKKIVLLVDHSECQQPSKAKQSQAPRFGVSGHVIQFRPNSVAIYISVSQSVISRSRPALTHIYIPII